MSRTGVFTKGRTWQKSIMANMKPKDIQPKQQLRTGTAHFQQCQKRIWAIHDKALTSRSEKIISGRLILNLDRSNMPAMPRTNNKAREIAYSILGCPPCLEEEYSSPGKKPKTQVSKKQAEHVESSDFKLDMTLNSR